MTHHTALLPTTLTPVEEEGEDKKNPWMGRKRKGKEKARTK